jgi:hypothetical protein
MDEQTFDTPDNLIDQVLDLTTTGNEVRLDRLRSLRLLEETRGYEYDGFTSLTSLLVGRCGLGVRDANREVFLSRSLPEMPYTGKLVANDQLTVNQMEVVAHARSRHPDQFAVDEPTLAEAATGLTLGETRRLMDYWVQAHDEPDGSVNEEPSRLHLSKTWQGRGRLDGDLDPEAHALLAEALDSLIGELVRTSPKQDLPPLSELRAEALQEIARRHLDSPTTPVDHGNRPNMTVVVDWRTLLGTDRGGLSELGDGSVISPETAQRLACDAKVCRLLTGPNSEILDLGRSRRTVSAAQWKALRIRDRHCQFPYCRRPWQWTDAHHLDPWSEDGETDLDGLVLICRRHHTLVHEGGWRVDGGPGDLIFTRPDGTTLSTGPP